MVHLHVRSWYSFLAGASSPDALVAEAAADGQKALALTDLNTLAGAVQFARACRDAGIKPIFGAEVTVEAHPLVLLCADREGYANLCDLLTLAHQNRLQPALQLRQLEPHTQGLFCLTGDRWGALPTRLRSCDYRGAREYLETLKALFPTRLFVELTHHRRPGDAQMMRLLGELAGHAGVPTVATNAVRHALPGDFALYDALTCAGHNITVGQAHEGRPVNRQAYLLPRRAMLDRGFAGTALANTLKIAEQCNLDLLPEAVTPPAAHLPDGVDARQFLKQCCAEGLRRKYPRCHPLRRQAIATLRHELDIIGELQLDEFLVVREVVQFARSVGIRCSGRGSAANSVVAYLLEITGVDPIAHHLLFERFLHTGRRGMPDIDIDFATHRRAEVIEWMNRRFSEAHTAMTANTVTFRLRLAVREVAKVLGYPLSMIDQATKLLPSRSVRHVREYRADLAEMLGHGVLLENLLCLVEALDNCPRHLSLHSGGMILSRAPLRTLSPIQTSANGVRQIQFNKDDVESLGLIKFDVLGLRMLSVVSESIEMLQESAAQGGAAAPDIDALPLDDAASYELIRSCRTLGLFQIESPGQWNLISRSQPEEFGDLVAQVALFRPGPLQGNMVHPYVLRRRGLMPVEYAHPSLEPVLRDTYGVILYQEQVLEVAHHFAGLSLSQADEFRRLMSKFRSSDEMEGMRDRFVQGAVKKHGVCLEIANQVFNGVSKFVGYGFCRSHAAAFAQTVYQTAYLKAHHPAEYLAGVLEHKPGFYPLHTIVEEARMFGVRILPVDIHRSDIKYRVEAGAIRVPFTQVKQVSVQSAAQIVLERAAAPLQSLEEMYSRVSLEADAWAGLARSGAFDSFGSRREMLWQVGLLARRLGPSGAQQRNLDGTAVLGDDVPELAQLDLTQLTAWNFATQDITTGPHPVALYRSYLDRLNCIPLGRLMPMPPGRRVLTAGVVISRQRPPTAKGMVFLIVEDETGRLPVVLTPPAYDRFMRVLRAPGLLIEGRLEGSGPGQIGSYRSVLVHRLWELERVVGSHSGGYKSHPGQGAR